MRLRGPQTPNQPARFGAQGSESDRFLGNRWPSSGLFGREAALELIAPAWQRKTEGLGKASVGKDGISGTSSGRTILLGSHGQDAARDQRAPLRRCSKPRHLRGSTGSLLEDCGREVVPGGLARRGHVVGSRNVGKSGSLSVSAYDAGQDSGGGGG